jgi:hypothetical protein
MTNTGYVPEVVLYGMIEPTQFGFAKIHPTVIVIWILFDIFPRNSSISQYFGHFETINIT